MARSRAPPTSHSSTAATGTTATWSVTEPHGQRSDAEAGQQLEQPRPDEVAGAEQDEAQRHERRVERGARDVGTDALPGEQAAGGALVLHGVGEVEARAHLDDQHQ